VLAVATVPQSFSLIPNQLSTRLLEGQLILRVVAQRGQCILERKGCLEAAQREMADATGIHRTVSQHMQLRMNAGHSAPNTWLPRRGRPYAAPSLHPLRRTLLLCAWLAQRATYARSRTMQVTPARF
jgi:hypothetical protein